MVVDPDEPGYGLHVDDIHALDGMIIIQHGHDAALFLTVTWNNMAI